MVNSCAAAGCTNRAMKNDNRVFYKLQIRNSELCKKLEISIKAETDINYIDCALIIDAMATKTSVLNDEKTGRFIGFPDYGKDIVAIEPDTPATEALVFMQVGLLGH